MKVVITFVLLCNSLLLNACEASKASLKKNKINKKKTIYSEHIEHYDPCLSIIREYIYEKDTDSYSVLDDTLDLGSFMPGCWVTKICEGKEARFKYINAVKRFYSQSKLHILYQEDLQVKKERL